jgi:hypothetical protein
MGDWDVEQYTGKQYGWERVDGAETRKEALEHAQVYRDNQPEFPVRVRNKYPYLARSRKAGKP